MQFNREINRLAAAVLLAFLAVGIAAAYWAVVGRDSLLAREDNPRLVEAEAAIVRGEIVDRNGEPLVVSIQNANGSVTRRYLDPATNGALGYFSLRYGVGGAEAAYDTVLRGADQPYDPSRDLLHQPQIGSDVQLTLDLGVQRQVDSTMTNYTGALVVMSVPDGQILALVSHPSYDPNTLDQDWDRLRNAPGNPFFNRVIQGRYQPGETLQIPLMAAALLSGYPIDTSIDNADQTVLADDVAMNCAMSPDTSTLTLAEAFAYACPEPFAQLADTLGDDRVQTIFDTFHLAIPVTLPGYTENSAATPTPTGMAEITETPTAADTLLERAMGQGQLTINPLIMAMIGASIIDEGNAPQPYTLLATRLPGTTTWIPSRVTRTPSAFMTAETAGQIENLMRTSVETGAARDASRPGLDIGGHVALSYSGEGAQSWFVGFVRGEDGVGYAVVVVLESTENPGLAADIGGTALAAAFRAGQQQASVTLTPPGN